MVKTSIVIPVYNGEKYLTRFLKSIFEQSQAADEVIIQDDASNDNSLFVIQGFIRFNHLDWTVNRNPKNLGWRANFESLLDKASGDIIFLADQDDYWYPQKIQQMTNIMKKENAIDVLVSDYGIDNSISDRVVKFKPFKFKSCSNNLKRIEPIPQNYTIRRPGWTFAISNRIIPTYLEIQRRAPKKSYDALLWQLALTKNSLFYYAKRTGNWLMHDDSAMAEESTSDQNIIKKVHLLEEYAENEISVLIDFLSLYPSAPTLTKFYTKKIRNFKKRLEVWESGSFLKLIFSFFYYESLREFLADCKLLFKMRGLD